MGIGQIISEKLDFLKENKDHGAKKRNPQTRIQAASFPRRHLKLIVTVIFNFIQISKPSWDLIVSGGCPVS